MAKPTVAEEKLLELLLADEDLRRSILSLMEEADYEGLATAAIFGALIELQKEGLPADFDSLSTRLAGDAVAAEILPRVLIGDAAEGEATDSLPATAVSCLNALRMMGVNRRIDELNSEIANAERAADLERLNKLSLERLDLDSRRRALLPMADAMGNGL